MKDRKERNIAVRFGGRLRLLREHLGMDQAEFGEFLDCSDESVSKAERGLQMMKVWRMIRVCQACDVSMDYLLRGVDVTNTDNIPFYVIEMYRNADVLELDILQDHMKSAQKVISRKHELEETYRKPQDPSGSASG